MNLDHELTLAVREGHEERVRELIRAGARAMGIATKHYPHGVALSLAIQCGHVQLAQWLCTQDVSVAPLSFALGDAATLGLMELVQVLVEVGADVHDNEDFALRKACEMGHLELSKWLVAQGCNVHARDEYCMGLAAQNGHMHVCKWLADDMGVDVSADDNYAIVYAARRGHLQCVQWLLERGADETARDLLGLRFAAGNGHMEIVQLFLSRGRSCANAAMENAAHGRHASLIQWIAQHYTVTPLLVAASAQYQCTSNVDWHYFVDNFPVVQALALGYDVVTGVGRHQKVCVWCGGAADVESSTERVANPIEWPVSVQEPLEVYPGPYST
jgi:ankyrin repeat protein